MTKVTLFCFCLVRIKMPLLILIVELKKDNKQMTRRSILPMPLEGQLSQRRIPPVPRTIGTCHFSRKQPICPWHDLNLSHGWVQFVPRSEQVCPRHRPIQNVYVYISFVLARFRRGSPEADHIKASQPHFPHFPRFRVRPHFPHFRVFAVWD